MSFFLSSAWHAFTNQVRLEGGINVETLGAAKVLDNRSSQFQVLDPGGASRDVTLPALGTSKGLVFVFRNTADAAENLVIKNPAAATIATLARGEAAVIGNESGAAWSILVEFPSVGSTGLNADTISEITAAAGVTIDGVRLKDAAINPVAGGAAFLDLSNVATGEADVILADNLASALEIREAANTYLTFVTTNSAEVIRRDKPMTAGATVDLIADPGDAGAIPVTRSGVCALTSAGAETRTLAIPTFIGQRLTLVADVYVGDIVVTASQAINKAGNTIMTFNSVAESVDLVAVQIGGALRWRVVVADVTALT